MTTQSISICSLPLVLALLATSLSGSIIPVSAQEPQPPATPERFKPVPPEKTLELAAESATVPEAIQATMGAVSVTWSWCSSCPQQPEVSVSGNTIKMGIANRAEHDWQSMASHSAAALLPAANKYTVAFDYDLYTWDSYQPNTMFYKGYWDSFSVSVSVQPYWQSSHTDPVKLGNLPGLGFITGGSI